MENKKLMKYRMAHLKLRFLLSDFTRQFNTENPDDRITHRYQLARVLVSHAHHGLRKHSRREANFYRQVRQYLAYFRKGGSLYGKSSFNISNFI